MENCPAIPVRTEIPWWRRVSWSVSGFLVLVHVGAAVGTTLYVAMHGVTLAAVAIGLLLALACGFSITGGYHRLFAHASYEARWPVRVFYLFFGAGAFQNSALRWAADHRNHHKFVDDESDPYNIRRGFWWAHIGWLFFNPPPAVVDHRVDDLTRDPLLRWQDRFSFPLAVLSGLVLPTALGALFQDPWGGFVIGGLLRTVLLYHATFCVNSLAHTIGDQPYSDENSSRDSSVTALVTLGEGYHNFHHTFPFDYRNGLRAYQFDPTKWLIRGMSFVGLARSLVRAPDEIIQEARRKMRSRAAQTA